MINKPVIIPASASDTILHAKDEDNKERIIFPFTRYDDVLSAPHVVKDVDTIYGSPFHLLEIETENVPRKVLRNLCGDII